MAGRVASATSMVGRRPGPWTRRPTGGGTVVGVSARRVGNLGLPPAGPTCGPASRLLQLSRVVNGVETVAGIGQPPGRVGTRRARCCTCGSLVTGTGPTVAVGQGLVRVVGRSRLGWLVQATDATAALAAARRRGVPRLPVELGDQRAGHDHAPTTSAPPPSAPSPRRRTSVRRPRSSPRPTGLSRWRSTPPGLPTPTAPIATLRLDLRRRPVDQRDRPRSRRTPTHEAVPTP